MALPVEDIVSLRNGQAPTNLDLVHDMTLGNEVWLDRFLAYYLDSYIPQGGSKVKLLVGSEGSGKTHLLRYVQQSALEKGFASLFLSARTAGPRLSDVPNLYRLVASTLDMEKLVTGLSLRVAASLGYAPSIYDGTRKLLPYIIEEGYGAPDAAREIRIAAAKILKNADISPSCFTFAFTLMKDRLISDEPAGVGVALRWFRGEKLERFERRDSGLFETLQKSTARRWLDSLLKLLVLSGHKGLVVLIDDLDVLYERSAETGRFLYSPSQNKDTYELIRQIIDDADLLKNLVFLLAGRRNLVEDEKRGLKSYEALWMRLQTGLVPSGRFNPLCDIVDVDQHLAAAGPDFPRRLSHHLGVVFSQYGLKRKARESSPDDSSRVALRTTVIDNAYSNESEMETRT
jgi:hypothetical protein